MTRKIVIIGAGGHSKVIADLVEKVGDKVVGFLDDSREKGEIIIKNYAVLGKISESQVLQNEDQEIQFVIAIGDNQIRKEIYENYKLNYATFVHPSASVGIDVTLGEGTVVMANACINASTRIGKNCIINTGSIVEHDNKIEDFVHICPHATLCGTVVVGSGTQIGAGATIKNNTKIAPNCKIGAGAVVVKNIEEKGTYIGIPSRKMKE